MNGVVKSRANWVGSLRPGFALVLLLAVVATMALSSSAYAYVAPRAVSGTDTTSHANVASATAGAVAAATGSSRATFVVLASFSAAEGIATPYGVAEQGADAGSQAPKGAVEDGATVYRQGSLGVQQTGEGQFWAGENPLTTPNYAAGYGMPGSASPDWVMGGEVNPGEPFVTREAPGLGGNEGGNPEVVTRPGGVGNLWFHMP